MPVSRSDSRANSKDDPKNWRQVDRGERVPLDHFHDFTAMLDQFPEVIRLDLEVRSHFDSRKDLDDPRVPVLLELPPVDVDEIIVVHAPRVSHAVVVAVGAEGSVVVKSDLSNTLLDLGDDLAREHQLQLF